ncbi:MAG: PspC domain-containing protein [bacterium]|nr:PspC domain-containing protein [bacterium]
MKETKSTPAEDRRTPRGEGQPKRLYKMEEGALISGVCSGLGVFFNLDPTVIRIIFVVLAILTNGLAIVVYLLMMIIVPYAKTTEDFARARGDKFNPHETERRSDNPSAVNSRAYLKKIYKEQMIFWREFLSKIFSPLRTFFQEKTK